MADFADFSMTIARYSGIEKEVRAIFDKLSYEQSAFTLEGDPIFDLLSIWIEKPGNEGQEITNTDLCEELSKIAEEEKIRFPFRGKHKSFAHRMANLRANLNQFFDITQQTRGGRKTFFTYRRKERI
jgi:hypothetical protein